MVDSFSFDWQSMSVNLLRMFTAANLWSTGAIGAAVAFQRIEIGVTLALASFALLRWLKPFTHAEAEDVE